VSGQALDGFGRRQLAMLALGVGPHAHVSEQPRLLVQRQRGERAVANAAVSAMDRPVRADAGRLAQLDREDR